MLKPSRSARLGRSCLVAAIAFLGLAPAGPGAQQRPPVPAFRSRIMLVPVDVRVLDQRGRPVTDLTEADFTILENGLPQPIRHFSSQALVPETPAPGASPEFRKAPSSELTPQRRRVFLLVLGRGRLQYPSKGVDAAISFVRRRLLPQDQVAVLAFNRATQFTTEHAKIARMLERFKEAHEGIEAKLAQHFGGLTAVYGSKDVPAFVQADIDRIFTGPEQLPSRVLSPAGVPDAARLKDDTARAVDALQRAELLSERESTGLETTDLAAAELIGQPFDDYVSNSAQTLQDLGNVYTGVEYMRYLEGEKHLVLVTERGLFLPRAEHDEFLGALASDARVVIDTIQTGGVPGGPPMQPRGGPVAIPGPSFSQTFAIMTLRTIADLTGGQAAAYRYADDALGRIDQATRFGYLLGYYPPNPTWDGRFRRIEVKVNRKGLKVLYRHGYYARDTVVPTDRRAFLTYTRMAGAGNYWKVVSDLQVSLTVSEAEIVGAAPDVVVNVTVGARGVSLVEEDGYHVGSLDIAFFLGDAKENLVGERWQTISLKLSDRSFETFKREGASYAVRIPARARTKYVKAVVYDYRADLIGSAIATLR